MLKYAYKIMTRTILHLDLDAFFCAVEEGLNPKLRGQTFAVGGLPNERGVVASCSYPARRLGIHSAMPMAQAVRICPTLIIVPPHFKEYSANSHKVMALLGEITPLLEQISIDEAFMDVTPQPGEALARRLQGVINSELKLPCSFGVASNMLVAKIANNIGKDRAKKDTTPNAITVVPPGEEAAFLAPLGIRELWGVGPKTAERLRGFGIQTIGDLARRSESDLVYMFGKQGGELAQRARGIDNRPVEPEHDAKSISKETTFTRDVKDIELLRRTIRQLAEGVGWRVRKAGLRGNTVKVKIRWSNFTTFTRQMALPQPTDDDEEIEKVAQNLFRAAWTPGQAVRLIGVGVSGFDDADQQLGLWQEEASEEKRKLQNTLDDLRSRFGENIVKRGSDINKREQK